MVELNNITTKDFYDNAINTLEINTLRQEKLSKIAQKIVEERHKLRKVNLNFICTHNSRRSQLAQVWAHYAIQVHKLKKIKSFSGGTETTAFHRNTIKTLQSTGFNFKLINYSHTNPTYEITNKHLKKTIIGYSKVYDDKFNKTPFFAITTCNSADENCPFIPEAIARFHLPYEDPKKYDNTEQVEEEYLKTNKIIAAEMNFLLEQVKNLL